MLDLIRIMVNALVDYPEQVVVSRVGGSQVSVYEIAVAKTDAGRLIGRQGRNANALRILVAAVAAKQRQRVVLQIIE
ncbi:MAG: KH domain-containing protein [Desulfobacterales bacterium]